jgi:transcriptional regulator with XRE-family HTH domain
VSNSSLPEKRISHTATWRRQRRRIGMAEEEIDKKRNLITEVEVGQNLRQLRNKRGLSLRSLAEFSGLNVNTLSLIENGRTSPSVSTLQQLATALGVPITAFFEAEGPGQNISYQKANQRPQAAFAYGTFEDLGAGLTLLGGKPLVLNLAPHGNSGDTPIVHTGFEFVYCLEGSLLYTIEDQTYPLEPDDSLLFEAHLPHRWQNNGADPTRFLLVLSPSDESDHPTERHFKAE